MSVSDAAIAQAYRELLASGHDEVFLFQIEDRAREIDATSQIATNSAGIGSCQPAQAAEAVLGLKVAAWRQEAERTGTSIWGDGYVNGIKRCLRDYDAAIAAMRERE
jgi:hypothetical protein